MPKKVPFSKEDYRRMEDNMLSPKPMMPPPAAVMPQVDPRQTMQRLLKAKEGMIKNG